MSKFLVKGGATLNGTVRVSGSKNAGLPIMCAALLIKGKVILKNMPRISDVETMRSVFDVLNVRTAWRTDLDNNTIEIDSTDIKYATITHNLVSKMRASSLLLGPLISIFGKASMAFPGGCVLGKRSMGTHLNAFEQMGAEIENSNTEIALKNYPKATEVVMQEMSVTGTENAIMALVKANGISTIKLGACEPHVQDLCRFLNACGAKIEGIGSSTLTIEGVKELKEISYTITGDYLEAGTLILAGILTKGEITVEEVNTDDLDVFLNTLKSAGANITKNPTSIVVKPSQKLTAVNIKTAVHPGFPTDLQAPFAVLMTQAEGMSEIFETLFEGRLSYLFELEKLGAKVAFLNPHQSKIFGPSKLIGANISSCDIRAGASMVLASLIAEGETEISNIYYIDRGYENFETKLSALGADIKRV